jgi:hypothetical protein
MCDEYSINKGLELSADPIDPLVNFFFLLPSLPFCVSFLLLRLSFLGLLHGHEDRHGAGSHVLTFHRPTFPPLPVVVRPSASGFYAHVLRPLSIPAFRPPVY